MKQRLHKPHGKNHYCGPTALSAITGLSRDDIAAMARQHSGRRAIKGMFDGEAFAVIRQLGGSVRVARDYRGERETLAQWLDRRPDYLRDQVLLVAVTGHYVAVLRDIVVCSMQGGEARHILSARCRNHQLRAAWAIELPPHVKPPASLQATKARQRRRQSSASADRTKARRLAAKLRLDVERDGDYYITSMAESGTALWRELLIHAGIGLSEDASYDAVSDAFYNEVLDGDSYGWNWGEVLGTVERVGAYARRAHPLAASMMLDV